MIASWTGCLSKTSGKLRPLVIMVSFTYLGNACMKAFLLRSMLRLRIKLASYYLSLFMVIGGISYLIAIQSKISPNLFGVVWTKK